MAAGANYNMQTLELWMFQAITNNRNFMKAFPNCVQLLLCQASPLRALVMPFLSFLFLLLEFFGRDPTTYSFLPFNVLSKGFRRRKVNQIVNWFKDY